MIYCEDCSSYDCGCPERKETESMRQQVTLLREALKQARHMIYYGEPQIGWNITRIDEVIEATKGNAT